MSKYCKLRSKIDQNLKTIVNNLGPSFTTLQFVNEYNKTQTAEYESHKLEKDGIAWVQQYYLPHRLIPFVLPISHNGEITIRYGKYDKVWRNNKMIWLTRTIVSKKRVSL